MYEEITEEKYDEMLNCLPPTYWANGLVLIGEPYDDDPVTFVPRYGAYAQIGRLYYDVGLMTYTEALTWIPNSNKIPSNSEVLA